MARTRLRLRHLVCAALALLMSVLSFALVLHAGWHWAAADGDARKAEAAILNVQLIDAQPELRMPPSPAAETMLPTTTPEIQHLTVVHDEPGIGDTRTSDYMPAAALSERPVLLQDIDDLIDLATVGHDEPVLPVLPVLTEVTGVLLINEYGKVDRLQFETGALTRYLEVMLAQRFAAARFIPGKIDGKPVRSALRIALRLQ